MWSLVRVCLQEAVASGVAPAVSCLAWRRRMIFVQAAGQADEYTVFDLASLTKPLAAALLALDSILPWSTTLGQCFGGLAPTDKKDINLEQLLTHSSGMPAWRPYYQVLLAKHPAQRPALLRSLLLAEPLDYRPGSQALYSDLGYMLLGLILEEAGGAGLDELHRRLCLKLKLERSLCYLPPGAELPDNLADCGSQPQLGRACIRGQAEDENAFALGGVAAHAGLFGHVGAVRDLLRAALLPAPVQLWPTERIDKVLKRDEFTPGSTRTAGFDTPSGEASSAGDNYPSGLIGHLGFTGVSCWWQPARDMGVVLLTNRVACGRDNWSIKELRPKLHNLIWPILEKINE